MTFGTAACAEPAAQIIFLLVQDPFDRLAHRGRRADERVPGLHRRDRHRGDGIHRTRRRGRVRDAADREAALVVRPASPGPFRQARSRQKEIAGFPDTGELAVGNDLGFGAAVAPASDIFLEALRVLRAHHQPVDLVDPGMTHKAFEELFPGDMAPHELVARRVESVDGIHDGGIGDTRCFGLRRLAALGLWHGKNPAVCVSADKEAQRGHQGQGRICRGQ